MIEEIWKSVVNYEGLYEVSNYGKVKSLSRPGCRKDRILKPTRNRGGYLYVFLAKDGKNKFFTNHRLTLIAFKGPCPEGMEARHLDGNQLNNYIDNLEWNFHIINVGDKVNNGRNNIKGLRYSLVKLNDWKVRVIRRLLEDGFLTPKETAKIFDITKYTISNIKNNKTWKHVKLSV